MTGGPVSNTGNIANTIAGFLPPTLLDLSPWLAWSLDIIALTLLWFMIVKLIRGVVGRECKLVYILPSALTSLAAIVCLFYIVQSHDWKEWHTELRNPSNSIVQSIFVPTTAPTANFPCCFILIDLSSAILAPPMRVMINGSALTETAFPLALLQPDNASILQCLAIEGQATCKEIRSYRHWWVIPCPSSMIHKGRDNEIEVQSEDAHNHLTIYGDYIDKNATSNNTTDGACYLPSLRAFSYTKGFSTFDHRDTRVFEKIEILGKTTANSRLVSGIKQDNDLSEQLGRQWGRYRIRLLVPKQITGTLPLPPATKYNYPGQEAELQIISKEKPQLVLGQNPLSFTPAQKIIPVPKDLPDGSRFFLTSEIQGVSGNQPCFIDLYFCGVDSKGNQITWSSQWQPIAIPVLKNIWQKTSFGDIIPNEILHLKNLHAQMLFSPFLPDYLYLKRKLALKCAFQIRDVRLKFLRPLAIPAIESRQWLIY